MKISKIPGLGSYGHFVDDLDFNNITEEEWMELGRFHATDLVTILRNVNLTVDQFEPYIKKWGKNTSLSNYNLLKKYNISKFDELHEIGNQLTEHDKMRIDTNIRMHASEIDKKTTVIRVTGKKDKNGMPLGLFGDGELDWHSNEAGQLCFGAGVALYGKAGMKGTATCFLTTPDWYESQSAAFKSELDEMVCLHKWTSGKINPGLTGWFDTIVGYNMCGNLEDTFEVPMVLKSPGGITGLHYSVNTLWGIKGMTLEESNRMFQHINETLFVEKYMYDHWWPRNNDLLLFDNSITLHKRLGNIKNRVAYRISYNMDKIETDLKNRYRQPEFNEKYLRQLQEIEQFMQNMQNDHSY